MSALSFSLSDMSNVLYLNLESILSLCVAALLLTLGYARWNGGQQCEISDLMLEINATSVYLLVSFLSFLFHLNHLRIVVSYSPLETGNFGNHRSSAIC
jgi:hypothetical protein